MKFTQEHAKKAQKKSTEKISKFRSVQKKCSRTFYPPLFFKFLFFS
jgi:hypothetical protein